MRVYIAGPISTGDLAHNVNQATSAFIALALEGLSPLCPHWSCFSGGAITDPTYGTVYAIAGAQPNGLTHADWLRVDLAWVAVADCVLRLPGESVGADQEVAFARAMGLPVFDSIPALLWWARESDSVRVS